MIMIMITRVVMRMMIENDTRMMNGCQHPGHNDYIDDNDGDDDDDDYDDDADWEEEEEEEDERDRFYMLQKNNRRWIFALT